VNTVRRDVERTGELSAVLRDSIDTGLEHREEAMEYALRFGRGLDTDTADRFVSMYVNELTCDYGAEGRQAVGELLRRAADLGLYQKRTRVDFVG
jgi:1,4-dihydroxy-6-naphthoate synthase